MTRLVSIAMGSLLAVGILFSQAVSAATDCESKAIGKNNKPLAGAAKTAFIKKCEADAKGGAPAARTCADKAIDKNGKPLAGAAKVSSIKKCEAGG